MDFAYLNAVVKSTYFPPYDPWFAGGFINYYYFGFVLVAVLINLTEVMPSVAYNLAVPTFFAMTAMGGFSVALNLAVGKGRNTGNDLQPSLPSSGPEEGDEERTSLAIRGLWGRLKLPVLAGLLAVLFVAVIGNLGQAQLLLNEALAVTDVEFETSVPGLLPIAKTLDGIGELVVNGLNVSSRPEKWYWDASRVIPHPEVEAGPISEFPFFTFLFADLHAHMLALPYTLLVLALAANIVRTQGRPGSSSPGESGERGTPADDGLGANEENMPKGVAALRDLVVNRVFAFLQALNWSEVLHLGLLALALGALWPLNTWDFPSYALVAGLGLAVREYGRRGRISLDAMWAAAWRWGLVLALGLVFFWPFHHNYASAYTGVSWWQGSRTPLGAYLIVHGLFIFIIVTYLIAEMIRGQGHNGIVRRLRLGLRHWRRLRRLRHLSRIVVQATPGYNLILQALGLVLLVIVAMLVTGHGVFALTIALMTAVALLLFSPRARPRRHFILGLIGLGLALTLGVELVVLEGDVSRMNTVFKSYLQVWVMWGVAAAACIPTIAARLRPTARLKRLWWFAFALLLMACTLYPFLAIGPRIDERFETQVGKTLDGAAYMTGAFYQDQGLDILLDWDRRAIEWLQENIQGTPVIVEASTPIYRWGSRVAIYTGLPTVIGWDWHQKQQRAILPADVVDRRLRDVQTIYTSPDSETAYHLLRRYGVKLIYVGPLERVYYRSDGISKFDDAQSDYWKLLYENEEVRIYQVLY
jgi:uncharacterized membrane protein